MVRCSNRWSHLVSSSHYPPRAVVSARLFKNGENQLVINVWLLSVLIQWPRLWVRRNPCRITSTRVFLFQSRTFCKIVQIWQNQSVAIVRLLSVLNTKSRVWVRKNPRRTHLRGFFFYQDLKIGHFWSRQSKRRPFFVYFNKVDTTLYIALTRQQSLNFRTVQPQIHSLILPDSNRHIYETFCRAGAVGTENA